MLNDIQNYPELFNYNAKTKFIVAKCFAINCGHGVTKKGVKFCHDKVIKIEKIANGDGILLHYKIANQLVDKLILMQMRANGNHMTDYCHQCRVKSHKPLTHEFIANNVKRCRTTVTRHLAKLEKAGVISVTRHEKIEVYDFEHEFSRNKLPKGRKPFISGLFMYYRDVNEYEILSEEIKSSYRHIIYNHEKRWSDNAIYQHYDF